MAMGDAAMDAGMIRFAGIGVAMPDGDALAQEAADWVTTPAEAIARLLAGHR
jgi:hydroxymethylpyrimidine pyrophosphatase-like HAD family hydrolase